MTNETQPAPKQDKSLAKIADGTKTVNPNDPNAIFSPEGLQQALTVCTHFLESRSLPSSYKNASQVLMAIQAGRELGMKPIESVNGFMVINGQVKLWGTALTGRVTLQGYKIKWGKCTPQSATVSIIDQEGIETGIEIYTIEDAKIAGLLGKQNWRAHPKTMLRWRALSNCVKFNFPHLLQGFSLVEDDDNVNNIQGEAIETVATDNATKLLNKKVEEKKEDVVPNKKTEEQTPELLNKKVGEKTKNIEKSIKDSGSELSDVLKHYGVKSLSDLTWEQAADLKKITDAKIKKAQSTPPPPPQKQLEVIDAETIEEPAENKLTPVPEDVSRLLNYFNENIPPGKWPQCMFNLKDDTDKGQFKGVGMYEGLEEALDKFNQPKTEEIKQPEKKEEPQTKAKKVTLTPDILDVSNELQGHDRSELNTDQLAFLLDVNMNQFRGKEAYPGVKF